MAIMRQVVHDLAIMAQAYARLRETWILPQEAVIVATAITKAVALPVKPHAWQNEQLNSMPQRIAAWLSQAIRTGLELIWTAACVKSHFMPVEAGYSWQIDSFACLPCVAQQWQR